jgi:hypoxanthine phosphoribosyltransferase
MKHTLEMIISEQEISNRVAALAQQIVDDYRENENGLVIVGLLCGSFIFVADLCRNIDIAHKVDFLTVSSYWDHMTSMQDIVNFLTASSFRSSTACLQDVKIINSLREDIRGKDVLIVDDIIDTGITLSKVFDALIQYNPKSIAVCALLDKQSRRKVDVTVKYRGFIIPDCVVVGYGLDYSQHYRHLPNINKVKLTQLH